MKAAVMYHYDEKLNYAEWVVYQDVPDPKNHKSKGYQVIGERKNL